MATTPTSFQFHKGTIKPQMFLDFSEKRVDFNSIKVRLNQFDGEKSLYGVNVFQFHKGTIKPAET